MQYSDKNKANPNSITLGKEEKHRQNNSGKKRKYKAVSAVVNGFLSFILCTVYRVVIGHGDSFGVGWGEEESVIFKRIESTPKHAFYGGDGEDRTLDLLNAIQALSQLSYAPKYN